MSYMDKELPCSECGITFTFTADEQEAFASRGYTNEPKRCPLCRAARRASSNNSSGFGNYGSRREMFPAVCAQCGKDTEVPFQPRSDRPVYCRDCYSKVSTRRY
ncbi:CxxC-x17-CxxC domain-containing protein [Chloroflexota bacterium]